MEWGNRWRSIKRLGESGEATEGVKRGCSSAGFRHGVDCQGGVSGGEEREHQ